MDKKFFLDLVKILIIKFSSVGVIVLLFLFFWIHDEFNGIGRYAEVTAIIAPLGVFSQFRYIEHISLSSDKVIGFLVSYYSSLFSFLFLSAIFLLIYSIVNEFKVVYLYAIMYKIVEMLFEFQNGYLISEKKSNTAIYINVLRLFSVVFLFITYPVFRTYFDYLEFSFLFLMLIGIFIILINKNYFSKVPLVLIKEYIIENIGYGFSSMFMSLNSLIPRYFYMIEGNTIGLGFFTTIYLLASTSVNVLQYLMSIKARILENIFANHTKVINFVVLIIGLSMLILLYDFRSFGINIFSYVLMTSLMLCRATIITVNVVRSHKYQINRALIISILAASISTIAVKYLANTGFNIQQATFYVCLSSWLTCLMLVYYNRSPRRT